MNLQQLRSLLKKRLRVDQSGRIWDDSLLDVNLNEALSTIQQDGSFAWTFNDALFTSVSIIGQAEYALPADFARLELNGIKYDDYMLIKKDYRRVFDSYNLTDQGTPSIYYLRGGNFGFNPLPNAIKAIAFLYRKVLPQMVLDVDDSGMPNEFNEALINYASYLCWADLQSAANNQKAAQAKQQYDMTMMGLYAQYLGRDDEANFGWEWETINPSR